MHQIVKDPQIHDLKDCTEHERQDDLFVKQESELVYVKGDITYYHTHHKHHGKPQRLSAEPILKVLETKRLYERVSCFVQAVKHPPERHIQKYYTDEDIDSDAAYHSMQSKGKNLSQKSPPQNRKRSLKINTFLAISQTISDVLK